MRDYFDKIYKDGFSSFVEFLEKRMLEEKKTFVITANPETLMIGKNDSEFDKILKSEETIITPDGIGVVKGAALLGYDVKERVTGVEISQELLCMADREKKSLYLFGAKESVLNSLVDKIETEYPGIKIVGKQHGYVEDKDKVFDDIVECKPDIVLIALGIPAQELLINKHYERFNKGIFIGVGGTFDVLSGEKKRAPKFFIKCNLEWLYRIIKEPSRFKRFYRSNVKFISEIKKMR